MPDFLVKLRGKEIVVRIKKAKKIKKIVDNAGNYDEGFASLFCICCGNSCIYETIEVKSFSHSIEFHDRSRSCR